jgi:hypothetical protein
MGATAKEYLRFEMDKDDYEMLSNQVRSKIEPISIDVRDFDYSEDEMWKELKSISTKAYKKLKAREYELRHTKK